jgi:hypothetical protein
VPGKENEKKRGCPSIWCRTGRRSPPRSARDADENQQRIEGVFAALGAAKPDNVSYIVLRLADSFVHVSFHDHGEGEANPITSIPAFAHFEDGHETRRQGSVDQQAARQVGAYITTIE